MKHLKTFEYYNTTTGQIVDYNVGDTIVCINDKIPNLKSTKHNPLKDGTKYKVLQIYKLAEDIYLKNPYMRVDIENLETGEISKGWETIRFKAEMESAADKYNF